MSMTMSAFVKVIGSAIDKVDKEAEQTLNRLGQVGVGLMKRMIQKVHAVDTGTMLNSTMAEKAAPLAYLVGPTVDYATYVAMGTSRRQGRPFHILAGRELVKEASRVGFDVRGIGL